ncbi:MAG: Hsp20/alpha crystallin family protein [Lachnospiraceae bacterium]|nr:Hsp20/alpha crystallin family protein [Lachnospiraceae bacterium]
MMTRMTPSLFSDNFFSDFFNDLAVPAKQLGENFTVMTKSLMRTDIKENDKAFEMEVELPGYKKEDVSVKLEEGKLIITAKTSASVEEAAPAEEGSTEVVEARNERYIRRERYNGSCSRAFYVGEGIEESAISAKFANGILTLILPKKQPVVPENKYIVIEG